MAAAALSPKEVVRKISASLASAVSASAPPPQTELDVLRKLLRKGAHVTGTYVPFLNQFLALFYKSKWRVLLLILITIFIFLALVFGAIFRALKCADDAPYVDTFLLTLLQLFGGNGMDSIVSKERNCVAVACVVSGITIVMQALLFSVLTARFMTPNVKMQITNHLICKKRDGRQVLQFRVASRSGHVMTQITMRALWLKPHRTAEGEMYLDPLELGFRSLAPVLAIPTTYTHYVDEESPLYGVEDIRTCKGFIILAVSATDPVLRRDFDQVQLFAFNEIEYDRNFLDCLEVPLAVAAQQNKLVQWDLANFDGTVPL